jgi:hypothetical protein
VKDAKERILEMFFASNNAKAADHTIEIAETQQRLYNARHKLAIPTP